MTVEHRIVATGQPPDPYGVRSWEDLAARLRALRAWAGLSYRAVCRQVIRDRTARGIPEQPVFNTVYRCFQGGRTRLDVELVVDIARVLLRDEVAAQSWRQACRVIADGAGPAEVVSVAAKLPEDPDGFVGRRDELEQLLDLPTPSTGAALVSVIDGMAGVGKTRLAVHAGHLLSARGCFTELHLAADLRGYDPDRPPADPAAVLDGFLRCLGVPGEEIQRLDLSGRAARYRRLLADKRALILLDNAAHPDQVRPLLPGSPTCVVLVTSRRSIPGLPDARHVSLDVLTDVDAMDLLRRAAGPARIDADRDTAMRIAQLLGNLPLALTLVAARIRASPDWTLTDHLERLLHNRRTHRLDDGVELAVGLSYQDLPEETRRGFLLLSVHPGDDVAPTGAAALAGTDLLTAQRHLDQLVAGRLLEQKTLGRYAFHDLIRLYAVGRAHDELAASTRHAALVRLCDHYLHTSALAMDHYAPAEKDNRPTVHDPGTPTPPITDIETAKAWLEAERANLLATAISADENGLPGHVGQLSDVLWRYLDASGYHRDAETLHLRALHHPDATVRSRELSRLGAAHFRVGRFVEAADRFQQALDLADAVGDLPGRYRALNGLASSCWRRGAYDVAMDHHHQALAIARQLGDRGSEGQTLGNLAAVLWQVGRYDEALDHHRQALAIAVERDDQRSIGIALSNIAEVLDRLGRYDEALDQYQQALATAQQNGNRHGESIAFAGLGAVYRRLGRYDEALDHFRQALDLAARIGSRPEECVQLDGLAATFCAQGRHDEALDHHRRALAIARQTGSRQLETQVLNSMGDSLRHAGSPTEALDHHQQALASAEDLGDRYDQARAHDGMGHATLALKGGRSAAAHWQRALRLYSALAVPEADEVRRALAALADEPTAPPR